MLWVQGERKAWRQNLKRLRVNTPGKCPLESPFQMCPIPLEEAELMEATWKASAEVPEGAAARVPDSGA